ncbi:hypothetical protein TNCT_170361, partial [Trichonephila clavata]
MPGYLIRERISLKDISEEEKNPAQIRLLASGVLCRNADDIRVKKIHH